MLETIMPIERLDMGIIYLGKKFRNRLIFIFE